MYVKEGRQGLLAEIELAYQGCGRLGGTESSTQLGTLFGGEEDLLSFSVSWRALDAILWGFGETILLRPVRVPNTGCNDCSATTCSFSV